MHNYEQPHSIFANSRFGHRGRPSNAELKWLEPFRNQLPEWLFQQSWQPVPTSGDGLIRQRLRVAQKLLNGSGWTLRQRPRYHPDYDEPLAFELLLATLEQERIALPFKRNLEQLGITMKVKVVDMSQYIQRVRSKDYDMLLQTFGHSSTPGAELKSYWHSSHASEQGSRNLANVANPALDSLLDQLRTITTPEELYTITSALDRIILWEHYIIPHAAQPLARCLPK